jgi:hypothetical protein
VKHMTIHFQSFFDIAFTALSQSFSMFCMLLSHFSSVVKLKVSITAIYSTVPLNIICVHNTKICYDLMRVGKFFK